jgi:DNA-binding response OmpR family regulator
VTSVLICSVDQVLSDLVAWNLVRRGFSPRQEPWTPCSQVAENPLVEADLIVADLDCPEPACWRGAARLRALAPHTPLVLFAHAWPARHVVQAFEPCRCLHKPFAVGDLFSAVHELQAAMQR